MEKKTKKKVSKKAPAKKPVKVEVVDDELKKCEDFCKDKGQRYLENQLRAQKKKGSSVYRTAIENEIKRRINNE